MRAKPIASKGRQLLLACAVGALAVPWSAVHAGKPVHELQAVDPGGSIEIVNVSGSVELSGWDRPELEVSGNSADDVDRVEITVNGSMSSVRVVARSQWHMGMGEETHLIIHVPQNSTISASMVASDLSLHGLRGDLTIQTVSGNVTGEVGRDLHLNGVSGDVKLRAPAAKVIEVKTISGDIQLLAGTGGRGGAGAEANITTVSGEAKVELPLLARGRFKSVSGDMSIRLGATANAQIDGESVSGTLRFDFAAIPDANVDIQTLSGDIDSCFGPQPVESRWGPGSRLSFKSGDGNGRIRVQTKSGDVSLCSGDKHGAWNHPRERQPESFVVALRRLRPMV